MHAQRTQPAAGTRIVLAAIAALLLGMGALAPGADAAGPIKTVTVEVPESALEAVYSGVRLRRGQRANIACTGKIWAGVWLTGENGPEGWENTSANSNYPLPGARVFSAIGKVGSGAYFYVGQGTQRKGTGRLYLSINDDEHNNGSGAFTCTVKVYAR